MRIAASRHQRHRHLHAGVAGGGEEQRVGAPAVGRQHADRHERVHRRLGHAAGSSTRRGGTGTRPTSPPASQARAPPTASFGTGRPGSSTSPAPARRARRRRRGVAAALVGGASASASSVGAAAASPAARAVADRLDGREQIVGRDCTPGSKCDRGLLGREVDGGGHAVEPVERLLDARRAAGTGHAGERQIDVLGRLSSRGAHGCTTVNPRW